MCMIYEYWVHMLWFVCVDERKTCEINPLSFHFHTFRNQTQVTRLVCQVSLPDTPISCPLPPCAFKVIHLFIWLVRFFFFFLS